MFLKKYILSVFLTLSFISTAYSQKNYSLHENFLKNPQVQIEATEAMNAMYNFEYKKAHSYFRYLKKTYPTHPLFYLLTALNYWWQIVPNYSDRSFDNKFLAYMDTTLYLSKKLQKINPVEGAFFLSASYAFAGRLYIEREHYLKASKTGHLALKNLEVSRKHLEYSPELLFGDGLFNYYIEFIRKEYPLLRPILWFFSRGDKEKGIQQLKEVSANSFYTRTEAQYYLCKILIEEKRYEEGYKLCKKLYEKYPENSVFLQMYATYTYMLGYFDDTELAASQILNRLDSGYFGYSPHLGRVASFFLGHIYEKKLEYDTASLYYKKCIEYSEQIGATDKGYYYYSFLHLGNIAKEKTDHEKAKEYYKKVKKISKGQHDAKKEAKEKLKNIKK